MESWALACAEFVWCSWSLLLPLPRVNPNLDLGRQPGSETASFNGPVWTAPPQDPLPGGGGAVMKGPRTWPSPVANVSKAY